MKLFSNKLLIDKPATPMNRGDANPIVHDLQNLSNAIDIINSILGSGILSGSNIRISQFPAGKNNGTLTSLGSGSYKVPESIYVAGRLQVIRNNQPLMENGVSPITNGYTQTSPSTGVVTTNNYFTNDVVMFIYIV